MMREKQRSGELGDLEEKDDEELEAEQTNAEDLWTPILYKRGHMMLTSLTMITMLLVILEFAYSDTFAENQYVFIIAFKFAQVAVELLLLEILGDALLVCPLVSVLQLVEIMVTMGAATFTDFVIAFFVEAAAMTLERVYVDPSIKAFKARVPLLKKQFSTYWRGKKRLSREQRLKEEKEINSIEEHIKLETLGVEPLLESMVVYSNETVALLVSPFLQVLLLLSDASPLHDFRLTEIPKGFAIRETDLVFYTIFTLIIIPAQLVMDMFLFNTLELVHGWKLFEYLSYQKYRYLVRETRWQMDSNRRDQAVSEKL